MVVWVVVVVALPVADDGLLDEVPLPDSVLVVGDVSPPLDGPPGELPPDGLPPGVALDVELSAALLCDTRCVDAGTAAELVARAVDNGLVALVDTGAEVWAASIEADALAAPPSTGLPRPAADDVAGAGWPCPATGEDGVVAGEMAQTMTAHNPTPTPAASERATRPRSGDSSGPADDPAGSIDGLESGGIDPVDFFAPGLAR